MQKYMAQEDERGRSKRFVNPSHILIREMTYGGT